MFIYILDPRLKGKTFKPATPGSAGIDMYACCDKEITLQPMEQILVGTGIQTAIPMGWVGLLYPRSGLGNKGLILAHTVGVIDSDYRGELKLALLNRNELKTLTIKPLDRVAQLVIVPHYIHGNISITDTPLSDTLRGGSSFGSSGVK